MVSFSCEVCNDTLTKKKLDQHRNQCRGASFTCIDCMTHFYGTDYRSHTSCISEAQKYQGSLYRGDKKSKADHNNNNNKRKSMIGSDAMVPRKAYVEDAPEGDESNAVAIVDILPRAPTPPPPETAVNALDFLVGSETPKAAAVATEKGPRTIQHSVHFAPTPSNGQSQEDSQRSYDAKMAFADDGYTYGQSPVHASLGRYDSWVDLPEVREVRPSAAFVTPAPKSHHRSEKKEKLHSTDKKRKRNQVEDLDLTSASSRRLTSRDEPMSDAPAMHASERVLHSGLTGGLSRLVTDNDFYEDRIDAGPTPISPIKRSKRVVDPYDDEKRERRKSSYNSHGTMASSARDSHHPSTSTTLVKSSSSRRQHDDDQRSHDRRSVSYDSDARRHNDNQATRRHHRARSPMANGRSADYDIIERPASVQPTTHNQLVHQRGSSNNANDNSSNNNKSGQQPSSSSSRADLFLSFIKGPDSTYGCSINKVLKRYHREREERSGHGHGSRDDDDKELWKALRLKRNERGEVVLFVGE